MSSSPEPARRVALVCALAAALRGLHGLARWEETAWRYAGYPAETVEQLAAGQVGAAPLQFTGLHPPLWPLLHATMELLAPVPLLWLAFGVACSVVAVALVAREDALAGVLLAVSPIQIHYCAEVNQYPLALLFVAAAWRLAGRGSALGLGLAVAGAGWTHLLAGVFAAAAAARLPPWARWRAGALALALLSPLALPIAHTLGDDSTFRQPAFDTGLVVADWRDRFGMLGIGVVALAAVGARRRLREAGALLLCLGVLGGLVAARIAAPHQFPYVLFAGPPLALLAGSGAAALRQSVPRRAQTVIVGVVLLAVAQAVGVSRLDVAALSRLARSPHRGVDVALAALDRPWTCAGLPAVDCSGDALILVSPPGVNDDDKRQHSETLWRLRPWWAMPRVQPVGVSWADHRHGHPRLVQGFAVYVLDHPRDQLETLISAHPRAWVVVYDQGQHAAYTKELQARLRQAPTVREGDHVYVLRGPLAPSGRPVDP